MRLFQYIAAVCLAFGSVISIKAQVVPNTQTQPSATTQTLATKPAAYSSTGKVNYVRTYTAAVANTSQAYITSSSRTVQEVVQQTQYVDGLGRPIETVSKKVTPGGYDLVDYQVYDPFDREQFKYLPYVDSSADGNFKLDPFSKQANFSKAFYNPTNDANGEKFFYTKTDFEASALNRPVKTYPVGNSWAGRGVGTSVAYMFNTAADSVCIWKIAMTAGAVPVYNGYYAAGELQETTATDERGFATVEYKDKEGHVILKKTQPSTSGIYSGPTGWFNTYYVYDDLFNLRFVIQPKATEYLRTHSWAFETSVWATSTLAKELCFSYEYDAETRMTIKRIPGAGEVYMVYDQRDRLVFTQDSSLRQVNRWLGTIYDALNRPVETGMLTYTGGFAALQASVNANTGGNISSNVTVTGSTTPPEQANLYITSRETGRPLYQATSTVTLGGEFKSEPTAEFTANIIAASGSGSFSNTVTALDNPIPSGGTFVPLTITNYDSYSGTTKSYTTANNSQVDDGSNSFAYSFPSAASTLTVGLVTSTKVRILQSPTDITKGNWTEAATFYDNHDKAIQVQTTNASGGKDTIITLYTFAGVALKTLACEAKGGNNPLAYRTLAKTTYDAGWRVTTVTKKIGASAEVIIAQNQYDELGRLLKKSIGQQRNSISNYSYTATPVDTLRYDYNIRGWLRGINKSYATAATNTGWFGMELNYDFGFSSNQLNGNIAGIKWRNANDGAQRAYGFSYDGTNRLTKADFTQNAGSNTWNTSAGIDFSVHNIWYDQNGNIANVNQMGLKVNASVLIDSLQYAYASNTNKLYWVNDRVNDTSAHLGDFTEINSNTTQDYWYDGNGNLTKDNNKNIANIHYNHLNLPDSITVTGKGNIRYIYDASGAKQQKITTDAVAGKQTITTYLGNMVYQYSVPVAGASGIDTLQYVATEEGRARPRTANRADTMFYDYFEKDHLGNTRVVLTDEKQQDVYPVATLESNTSALNTEKAYYDIQDANIVDESTVTGFASATNNSYNNNNGNPPYNTNPNANTTAASTKLYQLNGNSGVKTGLGITLKVTAGDAINVYGKSFWHSTGTNPVNTYTLAVNSLINAFAATGAVATAGKSATGATLQQAGSPTTTTATSWLSGVPNPGGSIPKAYINWVLFDEQFKVVSGGSGFDLVSTTPDNVKTHSISVNITQGGYLYVYCSNESNYNVFFDNLQVIDTRGPLLETDNYYPFGLVQSGISSQAAGKLDNKLKYNKGSELQNKEFSDGSGLEIYTTQFRMLDPQLGRWWQIDPKPDMALSPYAAMNNDPILHSDYLGDTPTVKEAALIAQHVYGDKAAQLMNRWILSTLKIPGVTYSDKKSGYAAALYVRTNSDGKTEYVFATRGSELTFKDWANNFEQPLGASRQYELNAENAKALQQYFGANTDLTFVGHSLGGGLAAEGSMITDHPAITFNAAGVGLITKGQISKSVKGFLRAISAEKINAYVVNGEIVNGTLQSVGLGADGNIHKISVPYSSGYRYDITGFTKHMMGAVLKALEHENIK